MSSSEQAPSENAGDDATGTTPTQTTKRDTSEVIFSMYINRALKFDRENVENWKGSAENALIFVRFFAVQSVTTGVYLQGLRLAFFLPRWLPLSPSATRPCNKIPTSPPTSSSHRYPNNFPTPILTIPVTPQVLLSNPPSPPPLQLYL